MVVSEVVGASVVKTRSLSGKPVAAGASAVTSSGVCEAAVEAADEAVSAMLSAELRKVSWRMAASVATVASVVELRAGVGVSVGGGASVVIMGGAEWAPPAKQSSKTA